MTQEQAIKTAAKWWTDKLRKQGHHDNGDPTCFMAMLMADMLAKPVVEDELATFQRELEAGIAKDMEERPNVIKSWECDYSPCDVLAKAAEKAGISHHNFPYKTDLMIKNVGVLDAGAQSFLDDYVVKVSEGYAQPYMEIEPCMEV